MDVRSLYLTLFNKTERDTIKLWNILGNFFISQNEILMYDFIKNTKYPCVDVFQIFNEKIETFLFFLETLQHQNRISIYELENFFSTITILANKIGRIDINKNNINNSLNVIYSVFSEVYSILNNIEKTYMHYCINEERYFTFDEIIENLTDSSKVISIQKEIIIEFLEYKNIINSEIFNNEKMLRIDL
jgi:hypothetical protein